MVDSKQIFAGLLTLFLGAPGQFLARLIWLNGSLHKPWLFLFFSPPFLSIISSIWFFAGWVDKGVGAHPVDSYAIALPILITGFAFIFNSVCDVNQMVALWLTTMTSVMIYAMARYLKMTDECTADQRSMTGSLFHAFIVNTLVPIINLVSEGLAYVPYIGVAFKAWNYVDTVPGLQNGILVGMANIIENMMSNTPDTKKFMCESDTSMWTWHWWILCIVVCCVGAVAGLIKSNLP